MGVDGFAAPPAAGEDPVGILLTSTVGFMILGVSETDGARLIGVPETGLVARRAETRVWSPMIYSDLLLGSMVLLAIWRTGRGNGEVAGGAGGGRLNGVPETVIAGPPGRSVWLPMIYPDAPFGNIGLLPIVRGRSWVDKAGRAVVPPPLIMTDADGGVPGTVLAGAPGTSV